MIPKRQFGYTGHESTRIIFGAYALSRATKEDADQTLEILLKYDINHIDTAPMYGNSEKRIGPWMKDHREKFFLATKTRQRSYEGAWKDLQSSLNQLNADYVDLWQMHGLTNPVGWEKAMGSEGTLKAFIEARDEGLARFLGVTAHGSKSAAMHKQSLERFDFDSVLLPYNYLMMQNTRYASDFNELIELCQKRNIAVQTIKSIARRPWNDLPRTYTTYFYEPLETQDAINKSVHWALSLDDSFLITAGDMKLLPKMLEAAKQFKIKPSEMEMKKHVEDFSIQQIFSY